MTAAEFTKIDTDFTKDFGVKLKARTYDARTLAFQIDYTDPTVRGSKKYEEAKDAFIDTTMSCDLDEAINWMNWYMVDAIAYGIVTKDRDWRYLFLAAYDLYNDLMNDKR